jgi:hypothetical protein
MRTRVCGLAVVVAAHEVTKSDDMSSKAKAKTSGTRATTIDIAASTVVR